MAPFKQHMYQHLRSAKEWLTKAEEAFDKEHDVRAELDLMLAQAELQHVNEANRSRQWRYKYVLFRHGMACVLAVFMVAVIGGVYWWTSKPQMVVVPSSITERVNVPVEIVAKADGNVVQNAATKEEIVPVQAVSQIQHTVPEQISKTEEVPKQQVLQPKEIARQPETATVVSAYEMQKLVRAAGKSLRGQ